MTHLPVMCMYFEETYSTDIILYSGVRSIVLRQQKKKKKNAIETGKKVVSRYPAHEAKKFTTLPVIIAIKEVHGYFCLPITRVLTGIV